MSEPLFSPCQSLFFHWPTLCTPQEPTTTSSDIDASPLESFQEEGVLDDQGRVTSAYASKSLDIFLHTPPSHFASQSISLEEWLQQLFRTVFSQHTSYLERCQVQIQGDLLLFIYQKNSGALLLFLARTLPPHCYTLFTQALEAKARALPTLHLQITLIVEDLLASDKAALESKLKSYVADFGILCFESTISALDSKPNNLRLSASLQTSAPLFSTDIILTSTAQQSLCFESVHGRGLESWIHECLDYPAPKHQELSAWIAALTYYGVSSSLPSPKFSPEELPALLEALVTAPASSPLLNLIFMLNTLSFVSSKVSADPFKEYSKHLAPLLSQMESHFPDSPFFSLLLAALKKERDLASCYDFLSLLVFFSSFQSSSALKISVEKERDSEMRLSMETPLGYLYFSPFLARNKEHFSPSSWHSTEFLALYKYFISKPPYHTSWEHEHPSLSPLSHATFNAKAEQLLQQRDPVARLLGIHLHALLFRNRYIKRQQLVTLLPFLPLSLFPNVPETLELEPQKYQDWCSRHFSSSLSQKLSSFTQLLVEEKKVMLAITLLNNSFSLSLLERLALAPEVIKRLPKQHYLLQLQPLIIQSSRAFYLKDQLETALLFFGEISDSLESFEIHEEKILNLTADLLIHLSQQREKSPLTPTIQKRTFKLIKRLIKSENLSKAEKLLQNLSVALKEERLILWALLLEAKLAKGQQPLFVYEQWIAQVSLSQEKNFDSAEIKSLIRNLHSKMCAMMQPKFSKIGFYTREELDFSIEERDELLSLHFDKTVAHSSLQEQQKFLEKWMNIREKFTPLLEKAIFFFVKKLQQSTPQQIYLSLEQLLLISNLKQEYSAHFRLSLLSLYAQNRLSTLKSGEDVPLFYSLCHLLNKTKYLEKEQKRELHFTKSLDQLLALYIKSRFPFGNSQVDQAFKEAIEPHLPSILHLLLQKSDQVELAFIVIEKIKSFKWLFPAQHSSLWFEVLNRRRDHKSSIPLFYEARERGYHKALDAFKNYQELYFHIIEKSLKEKQADSHVSTLTLEVMNDGRLQPHNYQKLTDIFTKYHTHFSIEERFIILDKLVASEDEKNLTPLIPIYKELLSLHIPLFFNSKYILNAKQRAFFSYLSVEIQKQLSQIIGASKDPSHKKTDSSIDIFYIYSHFLNAAEQRELCDLVIDYLQKQQPQHLSALLIMVEEQAILGPRDSKVLMKLWNKTIDSLKKSKNGLNAIYTLYQSLIAKNRVQQEELFLSIWTQIALALLSTPKVKIEWCTTIAEDFIKNNFLVKTIEENQKKISSKSFINEDCRDLLFTHDSHYVTVRESSVDIISKLEVIHRHLVESLITTSQGQKSGFNLLSTILSYSHSHHDWQEWTRVVKKILLGDFHPSSKELLPRDLVYSLVKLLPHTAQDDAHNLLSSLLISSKYYLTSAQEDLEDSSDELLFLFNTTRQLINCSPAFNKKIDTITLFHMFFEITSIYNKNKLNYELINLFVFYYDNLKKIVGSNNLTLAEFFSKHQDKLLTLHLTICKFLTEENTYALDSAQNIYPLLLMITEVLPNAIHVNGKPTPVKAKNFINNFLQANFRYTEFQSYHLKHFVSLVTEFSLFFNKMNNTWGAELQQYLIKEVYIFIQNKEDDQLKVYLSGFTALLETLAKKTYPQSNFLGALIKFENIPSVIEQVIKINLLLEAFSELKYFEVMNLLLDHSIMFYKGFISFLTFSFTHFLEAMKSPRMDKVRIAFFIPQLIALLKKLDLEENTSDLNKKILACLINDLVQKISENLEIIDESDSSALKIPLNQLIELMKPNSFKQNANLFYPFNWFLLVSKVLPYFAHCFCSTGNQKYNVGPWIIDAFKLSKDKENYKVLAFALLVSWRYYIDSLGNNPLATLSFDTDILNNMTEEVRNKYLIESSTLLELKMESISVDKFLEAIRFLYKRSSIELLFNR